MKAKLKSPDIAKTNGPEFDKKQLKKLLKEKFEEPMKFFYDSAFDYGGETGTAPFLYIGDIPTLWKKYIKEHKKEKTFAAGTCMFDGNGSLKLVIEVGKGGKAAVLKEVNKALLKPFAKAIFVDNINSDVEIEDTADKDAADGTDNFSEFDPKEMLEEVKAFASEGAELLNVLSKVVPEVGNKIKYLKNTIVTDELVSKTADAIKTIQNNPVAKFLKEALAWLGESDADTIKKDAALNKEVDSLKKTVAELTKLQPEMKEIMDKGGKISKVENPADSEFPPISDDPFDMFATNLNKINKSSVLKTYANGVKNF